MLALTRRCRSTVPRSAIEREYRSLAAWSSADWKAADAGMRLSRLERCFIFG